MSNTTITRRGFLKYGSYLSAASKFLLTGSTGLLHMVSASAAETEALAAEEIQTLLHVVKTMFPHTKLNDSHYQGVIVKLVEESAANKKTGKMLKKGIAGLNSAAGDDAWMTLSDTQKLNTLEVISDTEFFSKLKQTTVTTLYDDKQVWDIVGYEGEAYSKGGYIERGFDDLDWLPQPPLDASPKRG